MGLGTASRREREHWIVESYSARHHLSELIGCLREILDELASTQWRVANPRQLLLYGEAGAGKSHLLCDVVEHHVNMGWPAILVLGGTLNDSEPWHQIIAELDLPQSRQVKHFLGSLDAAAEAVGVRALLSIDALNERRGLDIWPNRLAGFIAELADFPRIGLILSCRSTYLSVRPGGDGVI